MFYDLTDKENLRKLLNYFFQSCREFSVRYPNDISGESETTGNPLLNGKQEFISLKDITVASWKGMKDAIEISGKLTDTAKEIFYNALKTRGLWNFSLWRDDKEVFVVGDFDDGVILVSDTELDGMKASKIIE